MSTNHALFPVKLLAILELFGKSKRGQQALLASTHYVQVKVPVDGMTRAVLSSPPLFAVINDVYVHRIRLAFKPDDMLHVYKTALEK